MKIRAGKKLWRRKPRQAPATIAERIAGSGFPSESAMIGVRDAGDPAHAGREAVQPVEEVHHVHDGDDEEDRERHADPGGQVDDAEEREREAVDPDAERRRDRGRDELAGELHRWREPAEVVDRADDGRDRRAEQDAAVSLERSRNASAGTMIPKKIARPPSRGIGPGAGGASRAGRPPRAGAPSRRPRA